jgi:hypothetical protein
VEKGVGDRHLQQVVLAANDLAGRPGEFLLAAAGSSASDTVIRITTGSDADGKHARGRILGMEPLAVVERLVELPDDGLAVADQRHFRRLVVADLLGRNVELDDLDVLRIARRLAEVKRSSSAARLSGR